MITNEQVLWTLCLLLFCWGFLSVFEIKILIKFLRTLRQFEINPHLHSVSVLADPDLTVLSSNLDIERIGG